MNESMNEWVNEWMNSEWMNERRNLEKFIFRRPRLVTVNNVNKVQKIGRNCADNGIKGPQVIVRFKWIFGSFVKNHCRGPNPTKSQWIKNLSIIRSPSYHKQFVLIIMKTKSVLSINQSINPLIVPKCYWAHFII